MKKRTLRRGGKILKTCFTLAVVTLIAVGSFVMKTGASGRPEIGASDVVQAPQVSFTNATAITIPSSGTATPYPSAIVASGLPTSLPATPDAVQVTINGYSHTFPDDVGIVLVGPTGAAFNFHDGIGDGTDMVNVTYTVSDIGATQLPTNGAWVAGTYKPAAYYTDVYPAPGPGSTYANPGPIGGGTATFSSTYAGTNPNGTWNLYVVDFVGGDSGTISGGWTLTINAGPTIVPQHIVDFDGDGKTDPAVVRDIGGAGTGPLTWFIQNSSGAPSTTTRDWGLATDFVTPEDFDGDGKTDIAVWRGGAPFNSFFYILQSVTGTLRSDQFGQNGDDPSVVGDYDGDGKSDPAVYRAGVNPGDKSNWYYRSSINGLIIGTEWGQNGDFPVPGEFDGDGRNDFVVQRAGVGGQGIFYFKNTTSGQTSVVFGQATDETVPGDYDGDLKTDIATVRGVGGFIAWYILRSSDAVTDTQFFGASATDLTTQGDWDGDGKTDIGVWRPNVDPSQNFFYWRRSSDGTLGVMEWGQMDDYPVANFNTH